MALVFNNLSSILLSEKDGLNHDSINSKIDKLVFNDRLIYDSFGNTIGRWHCYWYYDSNVKGYSKGDLVWLNVEDPYAFVRNYYEVIKTYTDLKAEIQKKLPDFDLLNEDVVLKYLNALSGYADLKSPNAKPLEPIFDLGDYSKPIQLAVSLTDNNKNLVSDETAWKKLFVDDDASEERIIELVAELKDIKLQEHLLSYHLSGNEEYVAVQLSNYLDEPDVSPTYASADSDWYAKYDPNLNEKQFGLDYVTFFVRKPFLVSGEVSQYQAVRYWKSGWIEHFGTLATTNEMFSVSGGSFFRIPFDWRIAGDASESKAYESGELAKNQNYVISANETASNVIPPNDGFINVMVGNGNPRIDGRLTVRPFKDNSYTLAISPIYQSQRSIEQNYIDASFGQNEFAQSWNSNFLTNEVVEELKTNNGSFMRLDTRVLAPYISYYATGMGDFDG